MNKGIVVTILTVLYFLWNIFAGIKLTWGGILMLIWGGRINIILFLIFALLFILIGLTDKKGSVFTSKYKRYAFPFILAYLFIYFYALTKLVVDVISLYSRHSHPNFATSNSRE